MSKKVIGPTLPPHLQHLTVLSTDGCLNNQSDGSESPKSRSNTCPSREVDDDESDSVLVLDVSDDEDLVALTEKSKPISLKQVSWDTSDSSQSSDDDNSFGPAIPPNFKKSSRDTARKSTDDDEASFGPTLPPNFKKSSTDIACKSSDDDEASFGPALPPNFKKSSKDTSSKSSDNDEPSFGPGLLPNFSSEDKARKSIDDDDVSFGPSLPPNFKKISRDTTSKSSDDDEVSFGPALPPSFLSKSQNSLVQPASESSKNRASYGPSLPPNFKQDASSEPYSSDEDSFGPSVPPNLQPSSSKMSVIGPTLPPGLQASVNMDSDPNSESDDNVVGPMPPGNNSDSEQNYVQQQLEARALKMKRKLAGEDEDSTSNVKARESWMLELPPDRAGEFGLGPRQFRARAKLDLGDRSVWTDTPVDKERKSNNPQQVEATSTSSLKTESEMLALAERDREMQKQTDRHNKKKKRKESLVNMHQEKLRKKQKKEDEKGKPKERRPFDRNVDLQANRFDEAQKKAILKKAQLLDDRFSRGETKFL